MRYVSFRFYTLASTHSASERVDSSDRCFLEGVRVESVAQMVGCSCMYVFLSR
jgi:hypothetical protein